MWDAKIWHVWHPLYAKKMNSPAYQASLDAQKLLTWCPIDSGRVINSFTSYSHNALPTRNVGHGYFSFIAKYTSN